MLDTGDGRALIAEWSLGERWVRAGLLPSETLVRLAFGERDLVSLTSGRNHLLQPVAEASPSRTKSDAIAFALALRDSRALSPDAPLQDSIYVERYTRLLPTYGLTSSVAHDVVLGYWLSGGASIPATAFRRLHQVVGWSNQTDLREVVEAAGFPVTAVIPGERREPVHDEKERLTAVAKASERTGSDRGTVQQDGFKLSGRPELEAFFNEHVVDILRDRALYEAVGIGFPAPILLHGPPGTGKTFAVDRLVEFLGWPCYQVDASSIASPYIHETSRKIAEVFETAVQNAPSVIVIDEVDAFLSEREGSLGQHRVEEVAEFLRRIPEATKSDVLVVAMTNRLDLTDPAVLRRGRFDHVLEVGFAGQHEIHELLQALLSDLPTSGEVDVAQLARSLSGRPLSDVAFVVREGARLAVRAGGSAINEASLRAALETSPPRSSDDTQRRVGFV